MLPNTEEIEKLIFITKVKGICISLYLVDGKVVHLVNPTFDTITDCYEVIRKVGFIRQSETPYKVVHVRSN